MSRACRPVCVAPRVALALLALVICGPAEAAEEATMPPVAISAAAPHRQALIVVPGPGGGAVPPALARAQADAVRTRDMLRLLGFSVTSVEVDTRPELKGAFLRFARRIESGGDVAVFVYGILRPLGEDLYLLPDEAEATAARYATDGLRLADALLPVARGGARVGVVVADACEAAAAERCQIGGATAPLGAIIGLGAEAGAATLRGELIPLMGREGLGFRGLFGVLRDRLGGSGVAASPELTEAFAFMPAGFLAGLPTPCNRLDPASDAEAVKRAPALEPLVTACAEAAATWSFAPRFRERLAAAREQQSFQRAADGCRPEAVRLYLDSYPDGRYATAARGIAAACDERRHRETPSATSPAPPRTASGPPSGACAIGGLDPSGNNWIALREAPGFEAPWSDTKMGPGTALVVIGSSGDWLHVRLPTGETGWAVARFVRCGR